MRIKKIKLENFRIFKNLEVEFPSSNFVTIIGKNGSGKTTFLDSIAHGLYTIIHDILLFEEQDYVSSSFGSKDITIGSNYVKIKCEFSNDSKEFSTISEHQAFVDPIQIHNIPFLGSTLEKNGLEVTDLVGFPILRYYRIERSLSKTENVKIKIRKGIKNRKVKPYYNSLEGELPLFSELSSWWINEENYENEKKLAKQDLTFRNPSLEIIRKAISKAFPILLGNNEEYSDIQVKRRSDSSGNISDSNYSAELFIKVRGKLIRMSQLSSGEKSIILLICDIARCLGIHNKFSSDSLNKDGIVLIDELDLHLHPNWQRRIIKTLSTVFPNVQFITTSHSPQILSSTKKEDVIFFDDGKEVGLLTDPKGRDSNGILEEIFGVDERPSEVGQLVEEIFEISNDDLPNEKELKTKINKLSQIVAWDDPILVRIKTMVKRKHSISV